MIYRKVEKVTGKGEGGQKRLKRLGLSLHRGKAFNWMTAAQVYFHRAPFYRFFIVCS